MVLVHGYPDNASVWDGVVQELVGRFRVIRYDVRGAGESAVPGSRDGYAIPRLVEDLVAVVRSATDKPVHLVAHDWGSIQAWGAVSDAALHDLFLSYTSISGPDLDHVGDWMRRAPKTRVLRQLLHSWYIGAFQVPLAPELVWRLPPLRRKFHATYKDARNGVELYRANMAGRLSGPGARRTSVPVQQLALTQDPFVTPGILEAADPWVERLWRRPLAAGHWAVREKPRVVARMIVEFIEHLDGAAAPRELQRAFMGDERPSLAGRLALVTGGGSGIGRATALALAGAGAEVLCVDIDFDAAARTAKEIGGSAFQLDVSDGSATQRLADHVLAEHGVPDIVMANAGVAVAGRFLDTSVEDWQRVLDVNLWGVIHTLRAFLPPLVARGEGGNVVVTASAAGFLPLPSLPAYGTTKAAVLMLAQCLSGELAADGIAVSAICPGFVHTNITSVTRFAGLDGEDERAQQARATEFYRRRGFGPEKVAAAVVAAVRENRTVVPVTPEAKLGAVANRVSPAMTRAVLAALNRRASSGR
ncbi:NAD(P)-dependent dehydrogenase (short-subunit alcohol dehydrogenase family)/pimeloyl-ACP methyl ester carboxylesterase [Actinophytocola algeriensis]|uniref:NAD(P)-dependent dehydrogenase (Short-subunit alcohol dehydrogenase family)/pimeloyl-ACP methyl ester carboxylesterase n=1 Tax=Actinophytocola algeriensis TaxID=1768010 RepID=A0A7W7Q765_9PSEU|nr:NAD(P)-dependent dehydrogenase (short-subunit alcohol dehydrogenase family)/pimeloyl-ACP methyl ester carboxylesterase [Actinophytocola algeriensis]MBE1479984.1 NAD(P)-dependent dehydrogenase (short-subunit alcohol dehydrogenase family)/pimeloyl-ACP methyl ester carboxylesterase [Actinophytocola algeriensis]